MINLMVSVFGVKEWMLPIIVIGVIVFVVLSYKNNMR